MAINFIFSGGCEPIPDWSNGSIAYNFAPTSNSLFTNGTVVTFNCSHELSLIGQSTARCLNGNWTNPPPICEGLVFCSIILFLPHCFLIEVYWLSEKPRLPIAVEILMDMGCAILLILVGITFMTFIILRYTQSLALRSHNNLANY